MSYRPRFGEGVDDVFPSQLPTPEPRTVAPLPENELPDTDLSSLREMADYVRLSWVGSGGRGEVWSAIQLTLDRVVAIKRIQDRIYQKVAHSPAAIQMLNRQFQQEALVAARLDHPNILPVYDFGRDDNGAPILVMKLVRGELWIEVMRRDFTEMLPADYLAKHLPIFLSMMQAVAFAHSLGIIHRDLKPSQVMVGRFGEVYLMDWGLAVVEEEASLAPATPAVGRRAPHLYRIPTTREGGNPSGTPAVMAPEQTQEDASGISRKTDIFLLGGTLYYLLTGRYPHESGSSDEAFEKAKVCDVIPPRRRAPKRPIPADLEELCMRCLRKDPAERPESVELLIEQTRRVMTRVANELEGEKIVHEACAALEELPPLDVHLAGTPDERYGVLNGLLRAFDRGAALWPENPEVNPARDRTLVQYSTLALMATDLRLARMLANSVSSETLRIDALSRIAREDRRRAVQARIRSLSTSASVILLAALLAGGARYLVAQSEAREKVAIERDRAENMRLESERMRLDAERSRRESEVAREAAERERYYSAVGLAGAALREGRITSAANMLLTGVLSRERGWEWGRMAAQLSSASITYIRMPTNRLLVHGEFSPDGTRVASSDDQGSIRLFDAVTGEKLAETRLSTGVVWATVWNNESTQIAAGTVDGRLVLLDGKDLSLIRELVGHTSYVRGLAFHPTKPWLASTSSDRDVKIWDLTTGTEALVLGSVPDRRQYDVDFSPDGKMLASSGSAQVAIYSLETGAIISRFPPQPENVLSVQFSPDSTRLLTTCTDRFWRVFNVSDGREVLTINNRTSWLHSGVYSPDGRHIATGDNAGAVRIWDSQTGEKLDEVFADSPVLKVRYSSDGDTLLATANNALSAWRMPLGADPKAPVAIALPDQMPPQAEITALIRLFTPFTDRRLSWYDYEAPWITNEGRVLHRSGSELVGVDLASSCYTADGTLRAVLDTNSFSLSIVRSANQTVLASHSDRKYYFALFSPKADTLAALTQDGVVEIFSAADWAKPGRLIGAPLAWQEGESRIVGSMAYDSSGSRLAIGNFRGEVRVHSAKSGEQISLLSFSGPPIYSIAFGGPDSRLLAAGGRGNVVTIWDTATGKVHSTLTGDENDIIQLHLTPDGTRIFTVSHQDRVKVWEASSGRELMTVFDFSGPDFLLGAALDASGRTIYAATSDRMVYRAEVLPWSDSDLPGTSETPLVQRLELAVRAERLGLQLLPEAAKAVAP